jgi:DNA modification methylase
MNPIDPTQPLEESKTFWTIDKLFHWSKNPRSIQPEDKERLIKQITDLGQYKPLIITKDGEILGGNMRFDVYQELGIKDVWVSIVNAETEADKVKYALSDNDRAGQYEEQQLAKLIEELGVDIDLDEYKVDLGEPITLAQLLENLQDDSEIKEDEPPVVDETQTISQLGEVYQLGRHRLMCGDAMIADNIKTLIAENVIDLLLTDPPYGINVVGKDGNIGGGEGVSTYRPIINDDIDLDIATLLPFSRESIIWGGNYLAYKLPKGGRWLVWDKGRQEGLSFSDCELAWTNIEGVVVKQYTIAWDGFRREGEVKESLHPTMKSIKLLTQILEDYTEKEATVSDYFGGSGSTLIACEQTNRQCYMMELDPKYCDVIRKRYAKFIDKEESWQTETPVV